MFCSKNNLDGPGTLAVKGTRIAATGPAVTGDASETLDFPHGLLLPGLVDLHAHPAHGNSKYGISPDQHILPRGVTTTMSQGDAGASNLDAYLEQTVLASRTRVLLAINLSTRGESMPGGCFENLDDADVDACVRAVKAHPETIPAISVNTSTIGCGPTDPDEVLSRAIEAGQRTDLPLLVGTRRHPDRSLADQLERFRPGDIVTYCFHAMPENLLENDRIRDCVWKARERGILFDLGHGYASFNFDVAEKAIAQGFYPDTISSDQYVRHVGINPPHDLARTLSKLIAVGLPITEALGRATHRPATILGLSDEIGSLTPGTCADLTVLQHNPNAFPLADASGATRPGGCWESVLTVRNGQILHPSSPVQGEK